MFKANTEGDSVWYRKYNHLTGPESWNWLLDIVTTNDTGFVVCGEVNFFSPDPGNRDARRLKLDSLGCDTPGCDPTVSIINHKPLKSNGFSIYPNPAENELFLQWNSDNPNNKALIEFYDVFGRKVYNELFKSINTCRIDVSRWQIGVYMTVVKVNGEIAAQGKFTVIRK